MPGKIPEIAVKVLDVHKRFEDVEGKSFTVLEGLSFSIASGERYALMGPSGAGKSSILSIIMGLEQADAGSIQTLGTDVVRATSSKILQLSFEIGFMPQTKIISPGPGLCPDRSVLETLLYFGQQLGVTQQKIRERFKVFDTEIGSTLLHTKIGSLSAAEQRLVFLFAIVTHSPKLLLLDEPTVGLDGYWKNAVWDLLDEMSAEGTSVLVVTHDSEEAMRANKIGFLRRGRLILEGNPQELLSSFNAEDLEDVIEQVSIQDELTRICMEHGLSNNAVSDLSELFSLTMNMTEAN